MLFDVLERLTSLTDKGYTVSDFGCRIGDQVFDFLGSRGSPLSQFTDLLSNNRETLAGIAGPGRLDTGVQSKQIGLEGDFVDHSDNLADLVGRLLNALHRCDGVFAYAAGFVGAVLRFLDHPARFLRSFRGATNCGRDLVESGSGLFEGSRLLLRAP